MTKGATLGLAGGGAGGWVAGLGAAGEAVVGTLGVLGSGAGLYSAGRDIAQEGLNFCNITTAAASAAGLYLSGSLARRGYSQLIDDALSGLSGYGVPDEFLPGRIFIDSGVSPRLERLAEAHLTDTGDTVLGSYPGYRTKANARNASYFDIGDVWDDIGDAERLATNRHFLDLVANRGDRILLSTPKSKIQPNTWLMREIQYLTQVRGYRWVNQWSLRPGG